MHSPILLPALFISMVLAAPGKKLNLRTADCDPMSLEGCSSGFVDSATPNDEISPSASNGAIGSSTLNNEMISSTFNGDIDSSTLNNEIESSTVNRDTEPTGEIQTDNEPYLISQAVGAQNTVTKSDMDGGWKRTATCTKSGKGYSNCQMSFEITHWVCEEAADRTSDHSICSKSHGTLCAATYTTFHKPSLTWNNDIPKNHGALTAYCPNQCWICANVEYKYQHDGIYQRTADGGKVCRQEEKAELLGGCVKF